MTSDKITTTPAPPPPEPTCPECGAKVRDRLDRRCWMCHEPLDGSGGGRGGDSNPFRLPEQQGDNPIWVVFGILAVLVVIGLGAAGPGILVSLLVLALPALIRAAVVSHRSAPGGLLMSFLTSLGVVAVVGVATAAAFFVTCFAVCMGGAALSNSPNQIFIPAIILSCAAALAVFILLIRALSRRKG
ncbi:MAG: hypothetical protein U0797_10375 [Gemmataceae bacterium]